MIDWTCLWIAIVAWGCARPPAAKPTEHDSAPDDVANRYPGTPGPPPLIAPPPTVCDVYLAALERMVACDKLSQGAREAMRKSHDQMVDTLNQEATLEAKQAIDDSCKQGDDAATQAAVSLGC